eukprot:1161649-Pelagomonas_calceolata.AAC.8
MEEGTCAVVENVLLHFKRKIWHGPEGIADLFMDCGESGRSDVLVWERAASSEASQVVSWNGLPSRFTQGKVVSAGVSP